MPKPALPACPTCNSNRQVVLNGTTGETAFCGKCKGIFDAVDPSEGGDFDSRNPAARLEREDREREKKLRRLGRR